MDLGDGVVIDLGVVDGFLLDCSLNGVWLDNERLLGDWDNLWLSLWCGLLSFLSASTSAFTTAAATPSRHEGILSLELLESPLAPLKASHIVHVGSEECEDEDWADWAG